MSGLNDIRKKINGIATTRQITCAMKMMSTARLGKATEAINMTRNYISKLEQLVKHLKVELPDYHHPCFDEREVNNACYIIIGGERGLCGGFNHELHRFALKVLEECEVPQKYVVLVGRKLIRFFEQKELHADLSCHDLSIKTIDTQLFPLTDHLFKMFRNGETDQINVIYTSFVNPVKRYLTVQRLIPVDTSGMLSGDIKHQGGGYDFHPSPQDIFDRLIPGYLRNLLYRAIIESSASEQSARMTSMTSATDRADEMISDKQLELNRKRQALITQEISEVIAGSQHQ